jgi:hypothetical protein
MLRSWYSFPRDFSLKRPNRSATQRTTCLVTNFASSPRGSRAAYEAVYLPPSNAEVQIGWSCNSTPPYAIMAKSVSKCKDSFGVCFHSKAVRLPLDMGMIFSSCEICTSTTCRINRVLNTTNCRILAVNQDENYVN